jgi:hypothetical protein
MNSKCWNGPPLSEGDDDSSVSDNWEDCAGKQVG